MMPASACSMSCTTLCAELTTLVLTASGCAVPPDLRIGQSYHSRWTAKEGRARSRQSSAPPASCFGSATPLCIGIKMQSCPRMEDKFTLKRFLFAQGEFALREWLPRCRSEEHTSELQSHSYL